jgi:hypothetical protein
MKNIRKKRSITGDHAFLIPDASANELSISGKYRHEDDKKNKPDAGTPGFHSGT